MGKKRSSGGGSTLLPFIMVIIFVMFGIGLYQCAPSGGNRGFSIPTISIGR